MIKNRIMKLDTGTDGNSQSFIQGEGNSIHGEEGNKIQGTRLAIASVNMKRTKHGPNGTKYCNLYIVINDGL